jgi:hypothetical protein
MGGAMNVDTQRRHRPRVSCSAPGFTFVTVAHGADEPFLLLQARSLARHLDAGLAREIVVVENAERGREPGWRDRLAGEYGYLARRVRFVAAPDVAAVPGAASGWVSQQILKLAAACVVATDRYVVLDAKNHLLRPLRRSWLEAGDGRLLSALVDYRAHPLRDRLRDTLAYFGLPPEPHLRAFLPSTTPFALSTNTVRELVGAVEAREGAAFPSVFARRGESLTEFFLLGAYIVATRGRLDADYDLTGTRCETVWPEHGEREALRAIARTEDQRLPFFAVHRRALPKLAEPARRAIEDLWRRHGLIEPHPAALDALRGTTPH